MQKLRRVFFFDRHVVKTDGSEVHPGVQRLNVAYACGSKQYLWLGDRGGEVRRLDRQFVLSAPLQLFDRELLDLKAVEERQLLVALGCDGIPAAAGSSSSSGAGVRYFFKVVDARRDGDPTTQWIIQTHRANSTARNSVEHRATCLAVSSSLQLLAVGCDSGAVHLFRGRDLAQDKPAPHVLAQAQEGEVPVTGVYFLEQQQGQYRRIVLFVSTSVMVRSWCVLVQGVDGVTESQETKLLNIDHTGGCSESCACVFPTTNALLVAKGDAIFAYDPDEGNMSAIGLEDEKISISRFKSYFIAVTSEGAAPSTSLPSFVPATLSSMPKQNVIVCLAYPHMRFIAYSREFTDVTHVVAALGSIFVISRGGAEHNTVLFELREKELPEQLDVLIKKRMFEWAAEVGIQGGASAETICDIYRQHGDALFEKRAYDQALAVYAKTVDVGLPLEPSYIVERYLDAQRIGHVAQYLKKLHEKNMAEREHTALLLKCYTKLKDFSTLEEFLETTPATQYDHGTAIEVLEAAGYYGLAAAVAMKVELQEDYVRISLEHFKNYAKTVEYLRSLEPAQARKILLSHGRVLVKHVPNEAVELVRELCGLKTQSSSVRGGGAASHDADRDELAVDEFLPIFVDDLERLEQFLRSILLEPGGPPANCGAERLFPTLLELLVRSRQQQAKEGASEEVLARSREEIMRLVRQYTNDDGLASTLLLSQTYGFVDGLFFAAERLGRYQLMMSWCFEQRDGKRLLQVCRECGSVDQSLWVQALSYLCAEDEGDFQEEIDEVVKHVEASDLMPLLMVIETLQQNKHLPLGALQGYLQRQFKKLFDDAETSRGKTRQDRQEIERMQHEIVTLRTQAQVFQSTKCMQCGLTLEVPAVHFFCGHSYHSYCMPADSRCPKCSQEALPKLTLKEQREAQACKPDDFFKYLQGGGGEGGVQAVGEWCKFGAFDPMGQVASQIEEEP
eukprot:TRINITY_DN50899_c0_g1_i1.p1 TRINITY_DN50899_c0_g1~~TRINITY_DN50899_c0_g1_i1.p1  ORF type:complete len:959 (+),score=317.64 TRINITY_DN50899_c0_g1_i1:203-3079(+)